MRGVLQLAGVAPAADDAGGSAWVDAEGGSGLGAGLTVELWRQGFEELALLEGGSRGCGRGCRLSRVGFREGEEDVSVVAKDYGGHRHRVLIVSVKAGQSVLDDAVLHYAADGGDELVSAAVAVFGLPSGEPFVEVGCLGGREEETDVTGLFKDGVEVVELLSESLEMFVNCGVRMGAKHVVPYEAGVKEVEDKAAEQAVLSVGDEIQNLSGCSGEERGKAWILDVHIFTVLAADVGYGLVVERLSEAVGVIAIVGAECVGEGVALSLEHQARAAVVAKDLIDCGCGGVGRDEEHMHRRFFWLLHIDFLLACGIVLGDLVLVFDNLGLVDFTDEVVDWFDDVAAESETAFAG